IEEARFIGRGCSISQASASMMTQLLKERTVPQAIALAERMSAMMQGDDGAARDKTLGDLRALAGVSKFPVRVKCALLPWTARPARQEALRRRAGVHRGNEGDGAAIGPGPGRSVARATGPRAVGAAAHRRIVQGHAAEGPVHLHRRARPGPGRAG